MWHSRRGRERYLLAPLGARLDHRAPRLPTKRRASSSADPNDPRCDEHDDPTYIVDLIKKVTTVSVETMKISLGSLAVNGAMSD